MTVGPREDRALYALTFHVQSLAKPEHIKDAEAEYQQVVVRAGETGGEAPSLLAFVLQRLSENGLHQVERLRFDLAHETSPEVRHSADALAEPGAVSPSLPRPRAVRPEGQRLPARQPIKAVVIATAKEQTAAVAEEQRREARDARHCLVCC